MGGSSNDHADLILDRQLIGTVNPFTNRAEAFALGINNRAGNHLHMATADQQFVSLCSIQIAHGSQRSSRLLVEDAHIAANYPAGLKTGQLLADFALDVLQRAHQRLVDVNDSSIVVGNPHVARNTIQPGFYPQIFVGHPLRLGDVEALLHLHRLQALQHLAEFVIARSIDVVRVIPLRQRVKGRKDVVKRPHYRSGKSPGNHRTDQQGSKSAKYCQPAHLFKSRVGYPYLPLAHGRQVLQQLIHMLNHFLVQWIQFLQQNQVGVIEAPFGKRRPGGQQALCKIAFTHCIEGIDQFTVFIRVCTLLIGRDSFSYFGRIPVDRRQMQFQRMVVQSGIRTNRIVLQTEHHLRTIVTDQAADDSHLLQGQNLLVVNFAD